MDETSPETVSVSARPAPRLDPRWIAALLALFGLGLRLWGIAWSLPNREHLYSYHPDEILVIAASHTADVWKGAFNPHFYNYGSLTIYLNSLLRPFASALLLPGLYTDYLLGRVLTALFGAGTVGLTYLLGRRMAGEQAGLLAGIFLCIAPAHVIHSHYVTVDVPATFWTTLCLYASVRVLQGDGLRWSVLSGVAAGLAAGTKYNAGLVLFAALVAHLYARRSALPRVLGASAAAFLLSTPGILLWTGEFWRDFSYEIGHTRTGHGLVFVGTAPGWLHHWAVNLWWGLGPPLLLLASAALIVVLYRVIRGKGRGDAEPGMTAAAQAVIVLLAFLVPYYLVISGAEVKFLRYTIPLLPPLLVLMVLPLTPALRPGSGPPGTGPTPSAPPSFGHSPAPLPQGERGSTYPHPMGTVVAVITGAVGLYTLLYTLSFLGLLTRTPPQDQAGAWLRQEAVGRSLGLTTVPWFYTPPVSPYNGGPQSQAGFRATQGESPFQIVVVGTDAERLKAASPDFLALSEFETADPLRLMRSPVTASLPDVKRFAAFWQAVQEQYQPAFVAQNRPALLPPALLPQGLPPHDWLYPYPAVTIWRKRGT